MAVRENFKAYKKSVKIGATKIGENWGKIWVKRSQKGLKKSHKRRKKM